MDEKEFKEFERSYLETKKRFKAISKGDLVWEEIPRWIGRDYHPAVVKSVNVDKTYIKVIDVSSSNEEKKYENFITRSEMIIRGFSKEDIIDDYKKYSKAIKSITGKKPNLSNIF